MLRHESDINGYAIHASDGPIGTVSDFLFDDVTWRVRWLVVDTGGWLPGRIILLPPAALALVNHVGHQFNVKLTKQQVKDCPDIDSHRPVSREREASLYGYYGLSPYWGAGTYLDVAEYGGGGMMASPSMDMMRREKTIEDVKRGESDPTLRSVKEVNGYHIHASDGEIGHVEDFLVEDEDWRILFLVVDTKNWWPGNRVLISPRSVRTIQWADQQLNLDVDRQTVRSSPTYDHAGTIEPINEGKIHKYDDRLHNAWKTTSTTTTGPMIAFRY
jgi:uncharacterized protein YrrD